MSTTDDKVADGGIGVATDGSCRHVELQRPKALNALNLAMVQALHAAFDEAEADPTVGSVMLQGAGDRGFCAGGDIRAIHQSLGSGQDLAASFWRSEYDLLLRIEAFAKPVVVLMDGIVMGGGVGLAMHASHRIVTERTRLAMPEVGIGFLPDVGATWRLPKAPSRIGYWVALTGETVGPADAIAAGLADVMIPSADLPRFCGELASLPSDAAADAVSRLASAFAADPGAGLLAAHADLIADAFDASSLAGILDRLDASPDEFAARTAAIIHTRSPMSLHVTRRLLQLGIGSVSLAECLDRELRTAVRITGHPDFAEGVRAAIVDKDRKPRWQHWTAEDARHWDEFLGLEDPVSEKKKGAPQ